MTGSVVVVWLLLLVVAATHVEAQLANERDSTTQALQDAVNDEREAAVQAYDRAVEDADAQPERLRCPNPNDPHAPKVPCYPSPLPSVSAAPQRMHDIVSSPVPAPSPEVVQAYAAASVLPSPSPTTSAMVVKGARGAGSGAKTPAQKEKPPLLAPRVPSVEDFGPGLTFDEKQGVWSGVGVTYRGGHWLRGSVVLPAGGPLAKFENNVWSGPGIRTIAGTFMVGSMPLPLDGPLGVIPVADGDPRTIPPVEPPSPNATCHRYNNCDDCTQDENCGWCPLEGRCVLGNAKGPHPEEILGCTVFDYTYCNDDPCSLHRECSTCLLDKYCGWCGSAALCVAGNDKGPLVSNVVTVSGEMTKCSDWQRQYCGPPPQADDQWCEIPDGRLNCMPPPSVPPPPPPPALDKCGCTFVEKVDTPPENPKIPRQEEMVPEECALLCVQQAQTV